MPLLDTSRFQDAAKYADYLKTAVGKLRSELAWKNLQRVLLSNTSKRRALDVGGGTGFASFQLARMGFEVVLLDSSHEMLDIAQAQSEAAGLAPRIAVRHADAKHLAEIFEAGSFDVVVCHNLLEYLEDPLTVVQYIAQLVRDDGVTSILVRNRAGEVLRAALKSGDWKLAADNLCAKTVMDSLFGEPVRVFAPTDVDSILAGAGLEPVTRLGVRVFSDYLEWEALASDAYGKVFDLELTLGARPEFAAVARYIQVIAARSRAPALKGMGQ
jgi:S-adenosylmethionine-dependent methyltransferase